MQPKSVTLNGLTPDELLGLPADAIEALLSGEPRVFQAGTADILGRFWLADQTLVLEFGHIDGGGEGVLPAIAVLAARYARRHGLEALDWRVHAINCARPNLKLRRVLERRGFVVEDVPGTGPCYHLVQSVQTRHIEPVVAKDRPRD